MCRFLFRVAVVVLRNHVVDFKRINNRPSLVEFVLTIPDGRGIVDRQ